LPAIGVAEALARAGVPKESIGFVGSTRPLEAQLLAPYGFELLQLQVSGLVRGVSSKNVTGLLKLAKSTCGLIRLAKRMKPSVVIGFGGYFSLPPILAARLSGVPTVLVETNAEAGLANRVAAKVATRILASSESCGIRNAQLIGVLLRPEITGLNEDFEASSFRSTHGIGDHEFLICVFGGSLGSYSINSVVIALSEAWQAEKKPPAVIYHVIGSRDFPEFRNKVAELSHSSSPVRYICSEFDPEIYRAIAASDLVISRAGSGTIAELGYFRKPSILVPLPNAPRDHQTRNARMLEDLGAALVISDEALTKERLAEDIERLIDDRTILEHMSECSALAFKSDGSTEVAEVVLALTGKRGA
jgi:UDP-N-acetylglucosamine--N-acetylmuramyl-(pentapeptide) pyrophosphoryl-undecaprenol N-acetylglucosamine transferase